MISITVKDRHEAYLAYLQVKRIQLRSKEHRKEQYDRDIVTE